MAKALHGQGRSTKVFVAVSAGKCFGDLLTVSAADFVRTTACSMSEDRGHEDRMDERGTRSIQNKIEGKTSVEWEIESYLSPTGSSGSTPDIHNLLLMGFGGTTGYTAASGSDMHTYNFAEGQQTVPYGFIMESQDKIMQRCISSAFVKTAKITLSNGVPKITFTGGGERLGIAGGQGNASVACGSVTTSSGATLYATAPATTVIEVSGASSFDVGNLLDISGATSGFQVVSKQLKFYVTVADYNSAGNVEIFLDTHRILLTSGSDFTAATSDAATATSLASAINSQAGFTATASSDLITVTLDANAVTGGVYSSASGFLTTVDVASLTLDNTTVAHTSGETVKLHEPSMTSPTDQPVSGVTGTVTWNSLTGPASTTAIRLTEFELEVDQQVTEHQDELLNRYTTEITRGWRKVSGSMKFRANKAWINNFLAARDRHFSDLIVEMGNISGYKVAVEMDKMFVTSTEVEVPEAEESVLTVNFEALGSSPATNDAEAKLIFR